MRIFIALHNYKIFFWKKEASPSDDKKNDLYFNLIGLFLIV